jgi:hypothetical protein
VGLHADPRRAEERGPPRGAIDDSAHPEGGGPSARTAAADLMADVLASALGQNRCGRFFTTEVWTWQGLVTYYTVVNMISRPAEYRSLDPRRIRRRY